MNFYQKRALEQSYQDLFLRKSNIITPEVIVSLKNIMVSKEPVAVNFFIQKLMLLNDEELKNQLSQLGVMNVISNHASKIKNTNKIFTLTQNKKDGYIDALQLSLISGLIGGSFMLGIVNLIK